MDSLKYHLLIGTGGIGSGIFFQLQGNRTLGRNESRFGFLLDARDFCKLHIICHYVAVLLRSKAEDDSSFRTVLIGKVGGDDTGGKMIAMMNQTGMDTRYVEIENSAATLFSVCFQYLDSSGGNITTADSASSKVTPDDIRKVESLFKENSGKGIALAAPEVTLQARLELLKMATEYGFLRFCALNSEEISRPVSAELFRYSDIISINRDEAENLVQDRFNPNDPGAFLHRVEKKCASINTDLKLCLTLGPSGSYGYEKGAWEFTPCALVKPKSTAGAGDATLSGLIISMAWGLPFILPERRSRKKLSEAPLETALDFAALLASLSVKSIDTINLRINADSLSDHGKKLGITYSDPIWMGLSAKP